MQTETALHDSAEKSADQRWADWKARGAEDDRKGRTRVMILAAFVIIASLGVWVTTAVVL